LAKKLTPWIMAILAIVVFLNFYPLVFFNIYTHSLPYGIYIKTSGDPERGSYAATCLTPEIAQYGIERGYLAHGRQCTSGTVMVLKVIEGLPGDHYSVENGFFEINGVSYNVLPKDSQGRPLRAFYGQNQGVVEKGKYILLSNFIKNSWDSRYWGPVGIQFLVKPLWIFDHHEK
jgi:conjugative transfer signal peptidase TraF